MAQRRVPKGKSTGGQFAGGIMNASKMTDAQKRAAYIRMHGKPPPAKKAKKR